MNYNKVIIGGHLTRDPEFSYLPSQTPVVDFGIAANRKYKTQDGQQKEEVCFVDCRCYGARAETINQYLAKGRPILVEGRLVFDRWEAQDGTKRSKHRITVENFAFVDSQREGERESAPAPRQGEYPDRPAPPPPTYDDIPF